jgi:hypothetical protein
MRKTEFSPFNFLYSFYNFLSLHETGKSTKEPSNNFLYISMTPLNWTEVLELPKCFENHFLSGIFDGIASRTQEPLEILA